MPASSGDPRDAGRITRRDFSRRAVRSAAGVLLCASAAKALSTDLDEPPTNIVPEKPAELDAALALARAAAPHLPEGDLAELGEQVQGVLAVGKRLRAHPLQDGREPDAVFQAIPLPEQHP